VVNIGIGSGECDVGTTRFRRRRPPICTGHPAEMEVLARIRTGNRDIEFALATTKRERAAVLAQRFRIYQRKGYYGPGLHVDRDPWASACAAAAASDGVSASCRRPSSSRMLADAPAIEPLVALARDAARPAAQRAIAIGALGLLGERRDLAFPEVFRAESNYTAFSPVLADVASIL
jgi:hypothetical protein